MPVGLLTAATSGSLLILLEWPTRSEPYLGVPRYRSVTNEMKGMAAMVANRRLGPRSRTTA